MDYNGLSQLFEGCCYWKVDVIWIIIGFRSCSKVVVISIVRYGVPKDERTQDTMH